MAYQSEAALEAQFVEQLNNQGYSSVSVPDYDALLENFKVQLPCMDLKQLEYEALRQF